MSAPSQQQSSGMLSSLSRLAKEHHSSVNAAHSALYGSPSRTSAVSRSSSASSSSTLSSATKEHPSKAYSTSSDASDAATLHASSSAAASSGTVAAKAKSQLSKGWDRFVEMAKEHHRSTNAAYAVHYGMGTQRK